MDRDGRRVPIGSVAWNTWNRFADGHARNLMFVFIYKECDGPVLEEFPMGGSLRHLYRPLPHLLSSQFPAILRQLRRALVLDTVVS
jgi:hypothetical protein